MSLADLSLNELITVDYNCKCGRHHHMQCHLSRLSK